MRWDAEEYHRSSGAQQTWARELLAKLALRGRERVLDLGCGDGKVTAELARLVPDGSVVGVDRSEEMIAFAAEHFAGQEQPNLSFRVMDAGALTFEAEFDVIFSNAVLHWVIDHRPVLRGLRRALRPRGRVLLQMGGRGNAAEVQAVMEAQRTSPRWGSYLEGVTQPYGFYGPEEYRNWLTEAGLAPRRVELIPRDMAQPGPEGLAAWVRTTWMPYTHRVPEERREQFIAEVVEQYVAAHPPDGEGRVHVGMVRLEVEAERDRGPARPSQEACPPTP